MGETRFYRSIGSLSIFLILLTGLTPVVLPLAADEISVEPIIEKAYQRLISNQDFSRWQVLAISTQTEADRRWQAEKIRRVTKWMKFDGSLVDEEILEAVEIEKGRIRNITEQYRRQRQETLRKMREEKEKSEVSDRKARPGIAMNLEDLIPFSEKNRNQYDFFLKGETELNGEKLYLMEARARVRKDFLFEGLFFINQYSYDLRRVELTPVKTPGFIREFVMEVDLDLWQNRLVMRKTRIKIFGRFLLKSVRRIVEEEYTEYRTLD